jgi:hypothetical protein
MLAEIWLESRPWHIILLVVASIHVTQFGSNVILTGNQIPFLWRFEAFRLTKYG